MKEHLVKVPYGDFVDGIQAMADLDSIRALLKKGGEYASDGVYALLGIVKSETIEEDNENA